MFISHVSTMYFANYTFSISITPNTKTESVVAVEMTLIYISKAMSLKCLEIPQLIVAVVAVFLAHRTDPRP